MRLDRTAKQGSICPLMAKTDRVLALLEALQDRAVRDGPGARARGSASTSARVRRDIVALRDLGIPVEGERGRGGSYRLKPGYRVPPLMFTPRRGRGGRARADGRAPARPRDRRRAGQGPPRPARPRPARRRVARAHARLHRRARRRAARRRDAARARRRRPPRPPRHAPATRTPRASRPPASSAPTASSPTTAAGTSPPTTTPAASCARCAPTASAPSASAAPASPPPEGFDADRVRQPHARPRPLGARGRGPPAHRPRHRLAPLPADARRARADRRRHAPAPPRRLARLGRRPARRRGVRLHGPPPARAPATASRELARAAAAPPRPTIVLVAGTSSMACTVQRKGPPSSRASLISWVVSFAPQTAHVRAIGVVEGALFEVHAGR